MSQLMAIFHHIFAFTIFAVVIFQHLSISRCKKMLVNSEMTGRLWSYDVRMLWVSDIIYGASALLLLIIGIFRTFHYEKGWTYYKTIGAFHGKLTLFIVLGIVSLVATKTIVGWKNELKSAPDAVPDIKAIKKVNMVLRIELVILFAMIALAVITAKPL